MPPWDARGWCFSPSSHTLPPRGLLMVEAISIVLFLGFVAACIASIIGVVVGVRQKRWRMAFITGSVTGVLLVLFVVAASFANFEEPDSGVTEQAAVIPTPEPTLVPTPIPVGGFGISRDDVHEFLRGFDFGKVENRDCPGTTCTSIKSSNPNVEVWLYGADDSLHSASVYGDTLANDSDTGEAMALVVNIIMPESADQVVNWILTDASDSLDRKGGGGIEQTFISGNQVLLMASTRTGSLTLTIHD